MEDTHVNKRELDLLLSHLLLDMKVFLQAKGRLKVTDFDTDYEQAYKLIWVCIEEFYDREHQLIRPRQMYASLEDKMRDLPGFEDPQTQQSVYDLAHELFLCKDIISTDAIRILQKFLQERRCIPHLRSFIDRKSRDYSKFRRELEEHDREIAISISEPIFPFGAGAARLGVSRKDPTGVMFVDVLLGGGTRPGEAYGFLAPTGAGKTTLINQIGVEVARQSKTFVIFHYEQRLQGVNDFWVGPYAYAMDMDKNRVEEIKTLGDFSPEERLKWDQAANDIGNRLIFFDFSGTSGSAGNGGVDEIEERLLELESRGIEVHGFAIDWFWLLMMRSMELNESQREHAERHYAQKLLGNLKKLAGNRKCWCWVNHQLQAAQGSQNNRAVKWNEAAELRSFAWELDCCFGLNGVKNGFARLEIAKSRNYKIAGCNVRLIGEKARFEVCDEDFVYDPRRREYVVKGKENAVPDDRNNGPLGKEMADVEARPDF